MKKTTAKINIPGDKSITHRAVIIASVARGKTTIDNALICEDTLSTVNALRELGVVIEIKNTCITVFGKGLYGLTEPCNIINCGNSATTMRLLMGLLSAQSFDTYLTGDTSLMKRPMDRVIKPLEMMGASIKCENDTYHIYPVNGSSLHPINYTMPVSSAQIKSAIMLADLYTEGKSEITDPGMSRNHTELMLEYFGKSMKGRKLRVPCDISSAAYIIAKALITPGSDIKLRDIGINPTRTGLIDALKNMGADITFSNIKKYGKEPAADIRVKYSHLHGTLISGKSVSRMIDELPLLAVLSSLADGTTEIRDAGELRIKESDRIHALSEGLSKIGVNVIEKADGLIVQGCSSEKLHASEIDSYDDHRIAMSFLILTDILKGISVKNKECVAISYPTFLDDITSVI